MPGAKEAAKQISERVMSRHVGSRVRLRGKMLRMSQEKPGDKRGIAFRHERGKNSIGADQFKEIAQILDVPVSFFLRPSRRLERN